MGEPRPTKRELHERLVHAGQQGALYADHAHSGRWGRSTQERDSQTAAGHEREVIRLQDELKSHR